MTSPAPLCFIDIETDGLHHGRRVWEVAMIRRDGDVQRERQFFVGLDMRYSDPFGLKVGGFWDRHPVGRKVSGKPPVPIPPPVCKHDAAKEVMEWTFGAHLVGVNPAFDADTLAGLLRSEGYLASWHYHLVDVGAMALGFLNADGRSLTPPWKSDELGRCLGVEPASEEDRHTALGDARWAMQMYDAMVGGSR